MLTKIYDLAYEISGDTINLEQDMGCGEVSRMDLHPIHLRLLAEEAGILAPSSNIEADRTIARLARQMRILFERIDQLDDWLNQAALRGHEDLDAETTYSFATWELAREFVEDLPHTEAAGRARQHSNGPENGCTAQNNGLENGDVSKANPPEKGEIATRPTGPAPTNATQRHATPADASSGLEFNQGNSSHGGRRQGAGRKPGSAAKQAAFSLEGQQ